MSDRKTRRSRYFSTGRSRTTRRLRIFQRNHLFDFVKISKYFKLRSGKRRAHESLSTGRSRTTRRLPIFQRNHLLNLVKISKFFKVRNMKRRAHEGLSTGRSRTTRRLRIFQRNHLLDFAKISKYFKVRSRKRFGHQGLVPMLGPNGSADRACSSVITFWTLNFFLKKCGTERPADRGISRPVGREQLADCESSSVITF